jgi:thiopurine S-methyltransferase
MDPAFWKARWESLQIGFHQATPNEYLTRHEARLTAGKKARILVPLCGKSLDMSYLAALGHAVVGVEVVEQAAFSFFADQRLAPSREVIGDVERLSAGGVAILRANMFDMTRALLGPVTAVFDRAALIALPGALRPRYVEHLVGLLDAGARILLVSITYDEARRRGPPFCVPEPEVRQLFSKRCTIEVLEEGDVLSKPENARFAKSGMRSLLEQVFLVTVR